MTSGDVIPEMGVRTPVILLVEDDVLVRFSTGEMLRDEGFVVLEAVNAVEALQIVSTGHPLDLVLSDIRMPGEMDGVALSYALKKVRPNLPVALLSSHLAPGTRHAGDAFLGKPYGAADLFDLVSSLIGTEWQSRRSSPSAS